jgi:hypothetical protein
MQVQGRRITYDRELFDGVEYFEGFYILNEVQSERFKGSRTK